MKNLTNLMTLAAVMMPQDLILQQLEDHLQAVKLGIEPLDHLTVPCNLILIRILTKGDLEEALNFNEELENVKSVQKLLKPGKN